ncbi:protein trichome birefringence-like 18 [Malania oleifera]|uniref:protein trichome birefringence-like 18 n=1 Tax=Malania oleifera TaxID=397392 RepID=UPI0025AD9D7E|nr:protein trichome birefringence-like 18 [Malania oleifera]XP_057952418.1 protein trichome birefringence-like 18 [Malania oleifera]
MTSTSPRGHASMVGFLRSINSIVVTVIALALFLIFASLLSVPSPVGSAIRSYFYGADPSPRLEVSILEGNQAQIIGDGVNGSKNLDSLVPSGSQNTIKTSSDQNKIDDDLQKAALPIPLVNQGTTDPGRTNKEDAIDENLHSESGETKKSSSLQREEMPVSSSGPTVVSEAKEMVGVHVPVPSPSSSLKSDVVIMQSSATSNAAKELVPSSSSTPNEAGKGGSVNSGCDLYHGRWFHDSSGPLYTNNTCPIVTQMQNCQGNGRPDQDYENWRWKPSQCDLPRFDAKKFLELMRGKTLAFIGDSVARNQMESMLCILWQVEAPKNRGSRKMQRWFFKSTSTSIVRIWSSWLVHQTSGQLDYAPEGVVKLHLDAPDMNFMEFIPRFDVIVLSSGHWFAKQSVYVLNNEIVGGQLWWPDKSRQMKINNIEAFGISVETILTAIASHPNYTGLTIVRSFSPDHYEGGAWNTGGSCTGKVKPALDGELVENGFTNIMHEKQVMGFNEAMKKVRDKSKLKLMDITEAFSYRHDGHPGPYRSPDPNKITKRSPDGKPPPQDCLHWCMPGPVDTWNELVLEVIRREFEGRQSSAS